MGVIAVQFQFWFQSNRHNKTQTLPPPPACCPAVLIGQGWGGAVRHHVCGLQMISLVGW